MSTEGLHCDALASPWVAWGPAPQFLDNPGSATVPHGWWCSVLVCACGLWNKNKLLATLHLEANYVEFTWLIKAYLLDWGCDTYYPFADIHIFTYYRYSYLLPYLMWYMCWFVMHSQQSYRCFCTCGFCHAMLCISTAYAVMRCPSVCPSVTFVDHVKTNKHIFEIFSPSGSHTILVFPYQTGWRYSDGNPPNGRVECKGGMKKSRLTSSFHVIYALHC